MLKKGLRKTEARHREMRIENKNDSSYFAHGYFCSSCPLIISVCNTVELPPPGPVKRR